MNTATFEAEKATLSATVRELARTIRTARKKLPASDYRHAERALSRADKAITRIRTDRDVGKARRSVDCAADTVARALDAARYAHLRVTRVRATRLRRGDVVCDYESCGPITSVEQRKLVVLAHTRSSGPLEFGRARTVTVYRA